MYDLRFLVRKNKEPGRRKGWIFFSFFFLFGFVGGWVGLVFIYIYPHRQSRSGTVIKACMSPAHTYVRKDTV